MGAAQVSVEKENLRRYILRLRDRLSIGEVQQKSEDITDQILLLHEFVRARGIACYVNKDTEVDTRILIRKALDRQKHVLIPVIKKGEVDLFFSEIKDLGKELTRGTFGVPEPKPEFVRPFGLDAIDLIIVPGIAWDKNGYRLGWGRGYFDRVLQKLPPHVKSAGLAFNLQLINQVPRDQFDVPVNMVITESRVIRVTK